MATKSELNGSQFVFGGLVFLALFIVVFSVAGLLLSIAWNALVPSLLSGPTLDWTQGAILLFVAWLISRFV